MLARRHVPSARRLAGPLFLALLLALGCKTDPSTPEPTGSGPKPDSVIGDFTLRDVNPNSPTYGKLVSPRQFVGKVSAWYFGHAT